MRLHSGWRTALAGLVVVLAGSQPGAAQSAEDCLACHGDAEMTGTRDGKEVSVHVDGDAFAKSVHGDFACVDCHADLADQGDGHDDVVKPVRCSSCHDAESAAAAKGIHSRTRAGKPAASCADCHGAHGVRPASAQSVDCAACHGAAARTEQASLHGRAAARGDRLAPTCVTCHGAHEIKPRRDPTSPVATMNVPLLCGGCHKEGTEVSLFRDIPQESILEHYVDSIHGEGLFRKGLTVTAVCTSCHTAHNILPHTDPASSIAQRNVVRTCMQCHAQIEQVHRQVIEGRLWEAEPHKVPVCVECHQPHSVRKVFYSAGLANGDCLKCHGRPDLAVERDGRRVSLFVDAERYAASQHRNTACAQCHTEVAPSQTRGCETIRSQVDCSVCHADQVRAYTRSTHGQLAAKGDADAPTCHDCHESHATAGKATPTSNTFARNLPQLCARCHRIGEKAAVRIEADVPDIVSSYADSVHGRGLTLSGLVVTATCVSCHSSHMELPPSDPESTVNPANLAKTCGTCHHGIAEQFAKSIHATGKGSAERPLPVCEDCHSSHSIRRHEVVGFRTLMTEQCGHCHKDETETFFDTFHGKVSRLGEEGAAKCSDCHGAHGILPPTDPSSTLARANVVATCGKCHEGSHRRFAGYLTHATHHDRQRYPWLFWSFRFMTGLLIGTLAFALLHTGAWLVRLWRSREQWRPLKAATAARADEKFYRRFSRFQRLQHLLMLLSFFTLAITGMAIKFSYAVWAQAMSRVLGGQPTMAVMHRLGAITLLVVFFLHLWDVRRKKLESGRSWAQMLTGPDSMLFNGRDVTELWQSIRWFLGRGPRPRYGRFSYWEKFDYFAVFWGVMIIGSTGFVLWFPELLTRVLPGWSINVATIVHSDEALLAVAFIFTIHFFNTHFRPDKFPMDPVIFTGRTTVAELAHDKPREYQELVESGKLEEHLVRPFPLQVERAFRVFGFIALTIGLTLVGLIVYAMVFAYR